MNILIADDHAVLRKGLVQILAEAYPDAHFGEASTTSETIDCLSRQGWDVLLLDIFMPGRTGLEILHEVRHQYPNLPVLVLSSAPEEQLGLRVLKAGASGYLNKQTAPENLVKAVAINLAGGRYISAPLAERLVEEICQVDPSSQDKLSDREFAVMQMLLMGQSIKEIADEMSLSAKTVSTFHTRIWKKFCVHNDVELVRYALEHGLVRQA